MKKGKMTYKGTLIPIGGNEEKGADLSAKETVDFIEEGILSHVVKQSGGIDARIAIIPTASSIPDEVAENYLAAFGKLGCTNLEILDIRSTEDANSASVLESVSKANCLMFSGGDQSKIAEKIGGTEMHQIMLRRFRDEEFVIAGTSAGAMGMSEEMIAGGSVQEAMQKGAVIMRKGLGLMHDLIIDSHFVRRGRFGRLAEAVAIYPNLIGVGLGEDTGLIIKNCNEFRVIGSGMVIVFDASKLEHNAQAILAEGTPMSMSNLIVHVLSNGDSFTIDQRKLEVLPMDSTFI